MNHKEIFSTNLKRKMEEAGKTRQDICAALGFSYYTVTDWVKGKKMPRMDKVETLANYFNCLISDLIEEKQPTSELSIRKKEFIKKIEGMSDAQLDRLEQILALVENTNL
jgi:transcriptional regulator with XRE-family HTH domain